MENCCPCCSVLKSHLILVAIKCLSIEKLLPLEPARAFCSLGQRREVTLLEQSLAQIWFGPVSTLPHSYRARFGKWCGPRTVSKPVFTCFPLLGDRGV